jgi:hypothetical protein
MGQQLKKTPEASVMHADPRTAIATARRRVQAGLLVILLSSLALSPGLSAAQEDNPLPPGMYRLEMIMASISRLPFFGSSKSASSSVSLVEIKREGNGLIQSHELCDFRVLEDSAMIKMGFPISLLLRWQNSYPIQIEKDGPGWRYRADLGIERIGINLA